MPRGFCPDCDAMITVGQGEVKVGTLLNCPACGVELEVLSLSPFELDYADFEEGEEEYDEEEWEDEERPPFRLPLIGVPTWRSLPR